MGSGWSGWISAGDAAGGRFGPALVDLAHRVVADAVGPGTGVSAVEPVQVGTEHVVVHLVVDRAPHHLILKVADARAAPAVDLQRTATVMGWARSAGAPVPAVLAAAGPGPQGAPQYLLSEYVQAVQWRQVCPRLPAEQVALVHRAIAEALLAVQSVRLSAFGELDPAGRLDTGGVDTGGVVAALRRRAALRIADEARRAVFLEVLDRDSGLFAVPAVAAVRPCATTTSTTPTSSCGPRPADGSWARCWTGTRRGPAQQNPTWPGWRCGTT